MKKSSTYKKLSKKLFSCLLVFALLTTSIVFPVSSEDSSEGYSARKDRAPLAHGVEFDPAGGTVVVNDGLAGKDTEGDAGSVAGYGVNEAYQGGNIPGFGTTRARGTTGAGDMGVFWDDTEEVFNLPLISKASDLPKRARYLSYNEITKFYFTVTGGSAPGKYLAEYDWDKDDGSWKFTQFNLVDDAADLPAAIAEGRPIMLIVDAEIPGDNITITTPIFVVASSDTLSPQLLISGDNVTLDTWLAIADASAVADTRPARDRYQNAIYIAGDNFTMTGNGVLGGGTVVVGGDNAVLGEEIMIPTAERTNDDVSLQSNRVNARLTLLGENTTINANMIFPNGNCSFDIVGSTVINGDVLMSDPNANPWWHVAADTTFNGRTLRSGYFDIGYVSGSNNIAASDVILPENDITVVVNGPFMHNNNTMNVVNSSTLIFNGQGSRHWVTGTWIDGTDQNIAFKGEGTINVGSTVTTPQYAKGTVVFGDGLDYTYYGDLTVQPNGIAVVGENTKLNLVKNGNGTLNLVDPVAGLYPGGKIWMKDGAELGVPGYVYNSYTVTEGERGSEARITLYGRTTPVYTLAAPYGKRTEERAGERLDHANDGVVTDWRIYSVPNPMSPCEHEWETESEVPTCLTDGYTVDICNICNEDKDYILLPAIGGAHVGVERKTNSCKEAGERIVECLDCGYVFETEAILAEPCGVCEDCIQTTAEVKAAMEAAINDYYAVNKTTRAEMEALLNEQITDATISMKLVGYEHVDSTVLEWGSITGTIVIYVNGDPKDVMDLYIGIHPLPNSEISFDPQGGTILEMMGIVDRNNRDNVTVTGETKNVPGDWHKRGNVPGFGYTRNDGSSAWDMTWEWDPVLEVFRVPHEIPELRDQDRLNVQMRYVGYNETTKFYFEVTGGAAPGIYLAERNNSDDVTDWTFTMFNQVTDTATLTAALDDKADDRPIMLRGSAELDTDGLVIDKPILTIGGVLTLSGDEMVVDTWISVVGKDGPAINISGNDFQMTANGVLGGGTININGDNAVVGVDNDDPVVPGRLNLLAGFLNVYGKNTTINAEVIVSANQHMEFHDGPTVFNGDLYARVENSNSHKCFAADVTFNGKMLIPGAMCVGWVNFGSLNDNMASAILPESGSVTVTLNDEFVIANNPVYIRNGANLVLAADQVIHDIIGTWMDGSIIRTTIAPDMNQTANPHAKAIQVGIGGDYEYSEKLMSGISTARNNPSLNPGTLTIADDVTFLGEISVNPNGKIIIEEGKTLTMARNSDYALHLMNPAGNTINAATGEKQFPGGQIFLKAAATLNVNEMPYSSYVITEGANSIENRIMLYGTKTPANKTTKVMAGSTFVRANTPDYLTWTPSNFRVYTAPTPVTISGVTAADGVYNGQHQIGYTGTPELKTEDGTIVKDTDLEVTYKKAKTEPEEEEEVPTNRLSSLSIAAVGDSTTIGVGAENTGTGNYVAQLERKLKTDFSAVSWDIRNFGASGHALQRNSNTPYWNSSLYELSKSFNPDVVLIMLGTNDAKTVNRNGVTAFMKDYADLVNEYRSLPSSPKVYLMTPVAMGLDPDAGNNFSGEFKGGAVYISEITKAIKDYGEAQGLNVIDINALTTPYQNLIPDGIHPNENGYKLIADAVYNTLIEEYGDAIVYCNCDRCDEGHCIEEVCCGLCDEEDPCVPCTCPDPSIPPTEVGDYIVTIRTAANTEYSGEVSLPFSITPRELTITAEDKEMYTGEDVPELTYAIDNLVDGDELLIEPSLSINGLDVNAPGTYSIVASGAEASDNYTIKYVAGKLTVATAIIAIKKGDVDEDGDITLIDAQLTLRAALKITSLTGNALIAADVDEDGDITLIDAQQILRAALKIITLE